MHHRPRSERNEPTLVAWNPFVICISREIPSCWPMPGIGAALRSWPRWEPKPSERPRPGSPSLVGFLTVAECRWTKRSITPPTSDRSPACPSRPTWRTATAARRRRWPTPFVGPLRRDLPAVRSRTRSWVPATPSTWPRHSSECPQRFKRHGGWGATSCWWLGPMACCIATTPSMTPSNGSKPSPRSGLTVSTSRCCPTFRRSNGCARQWTFRSTCWSSGR